MGLLDDLKSEYKIGGITQRLIFWNVGLFIIPFIVFSLLKLGGILVPALDWTVGGTQNWLSLSSDPADLLWKPWTLVTYAFLHSGFLHVFFNMLWLFFAGRMFLTFFTQKQLFGLYILSAIFAGLVFILGYELLPLVRGVKAPMVGASAAVMAILVASAVYAPYYPVRMPLIGTIKLWHIAAFFIVSDLIYVSVENTGGHIAHLAGALFGYIYIKLLQNGTDLSKGVSNSITFFENIFKPKQKHTFKKVHRNPAPYNKKTTTQPKDLTQQQIDDILDKISKSGYDSLTKEEKEFLFKVGK
ncbi:rhomboid family intramembrane serine protease [Flavobacterium salilacus subsp. salilacus]|uniref:rhomboid family protein n=1 Tax=Flavobacterium TaxID=237 RepID=UPI00107523C3|nr:MULTISPECIES: rhomboid family intramembrane serine protease [Flavobacterium]KAF2519515.1 rhomboid family intramembrane serine protease [Flavobacterium salilacus subsp. salilacus]MBE1614587.1 rhomboid family intramembrane serine protease [Flavobacterium sp. SaA2.13]